ncbi:MAG: hypothetical protein KDD11_20065 [Acidobacteria bacterium]|nr:hypothetical protein [Acidobacteriota bacterium]
MIWGDLVLDRVDSKEALRIALSHAFGINSTDVWVVDDVAEIPSPGTALVVCQQSQRGGEFPWRLSVYTFSNDLTSSHIEIAQGLARELGARCLLPDPSRDPYTMLLVTESETKSVDVDVDKLDRRDEYRLA